MPDTRHPFTPAVLMYAPAAPGMYLLWDRDVLLFVGHAEAPATILHRLMDHYCGRATPSQATHCSWQVGEANLAFQRLPDLRQPAEARDPDYAEAD